MYLFAFLDDHKNGAAHGDFWLGHYYIHTYIVASLATRLSTRRR